MLAALLVRILSLLHPQAALVWPDGARDPVVARPGETYGAERFAVEVAGLPRREYRGKLHVGRGERELLLTNEVGVEDYVASVVAAELDDAPLAAREALAIVARTFALQNADLCDTTHCQWYRGTLREDREAAGRTAGLVLHGALARHHADQAGHRPGLCQTGARSLATKGASAHQILARYFPNARIGR